MTSMLRTSRLTEQVATYSLGTDFAVLPDNVVDCTKRVVLDTLGCIVLGSTIDAGRIMGDYVRAVGGRADASVVGGGTSAPAAYAARSFPRRSASSHCGGKIPVLSDAPPT